MSFKEAILKIIDIDTLCKMNHFVYQSISERSMLVDTDMDYSVIMFVSGGKTSFDIDGNVFTVESKKKAVVLPRSSSVEIVFSAGVEVVTYSFTDYLDLSTETAKSIQLINREENNSVNTLSMNAYVDLLLMEIKALLFENEVSEVMHRIYFVKVIKFLEKHHGSRVFASFLSPTVSGRYKSVEKYHKKLLSIQNNSKNRPKLEL